jgi:cephalosporin hydroxylase
MRSFTTAFTAPMLEGYQSGVMSYTYRGVRCLKSPIDIALYMKLLWDIKPGLVVEIGSHSGGSALLLADLLNSFGLQTPVISVDLEPPQGISRDGITFLAGDVMDLGSVFRENNLDDHPHPWFITEDSAHSYQGCMAAIRALSGYMAPGDVLAIEDGVLDDLGLSARYDGGPNRAIADYLTAHPGEFRIMTELCDMFGPNATYNPNGYLCKL